MLMFMNNITILINHHQFLIQPEYLSLSSSQLFFLFFLSDVQFSLVRIMKHSFSRLSVFVYSAICLSHGSVGSEYTE